MSCVTVLYLQDVLELAGVEIRASAVTNEGYVSDAVVNRASTDDDLTLCENTLYAQSPTEQQHQQQFAVPCAYVPLHEDANVHGICV